MRRLTATFAAAAIAAGPRPLRPGRVRGSTRRRTERRSPGGGKCLSLRSSGGQATATSAAASIATTSLATSAGSIATTIRGSIAAGAAMGRAIAVATGNAYGRRDRVEGRRTFDSGYQGRPGVVFGPGGRGNERCFVDGAGRKGLPLRRLGPMQMKWPAMRRPLSFQPRRLRPEASASCSISGLSAAASSHFAQ
jgi:hypothetical protein